MRETLHARRGSVASVVAQLGIAYFYACDLLAPAAGLPVPAHQKLCMSGASKPCSCGALVTTQPGVAAYMLLRPSSVRAVMAEQWRCAVRRRR